MTSATPFHVGESLVQTCMGVRESIEPFARRVVRDHMPEQHRAFYRRLPFVVLAARDGEARPWATVVADPDGVLDSPDPWTLDFHVLPVPGDALADALRYGADIGLLGIEFHTRRRNRVNGQLAARSDDGFRFVVAQSFGNCPQYIHSRQWLSTKPARPPAQRSGKRLEASQRRWIARADTFFLASGYRGEGDDRAFGMDASHRGGNPGFVRVVDDETLMWPDFAGNNHFNTIGNLVMDRRIGMLFVDFESGSLLQLSGRAEIDWTPESSHWPGAQRLVRVRVEAVNELRDALPLRWRATEQIELCVDDIVDECADVRSFWLVGAQGATLPPFTAGQHLTVEVPIDGRHALRTYSLSSAPGETRWRISVKRDPEGRVSSYLHEKIAVGATLNAAIPAGDFILEEGLGPVVLIGAGIGVTPLLSMLGEAVSRGREVLFVHAARNGTQAPLAAEIRGRAGNRAMRVHTVFSQPDPFDRQGIDFDTKGRLTAATLSTILPRRVADTYICGPAGFVNSVTGWLEALEIPAARIRSESFG